MEPLGVILTGGRATRLRPLSDAMPKSLIPLLNRPLLAYSMEMLAAAGIHELVVVAGAEDHRTGPAAAEWAPAGVRIAVARQAEPRGSGDALLSAGSALDGRHVVVAAVDTVLRGDLAPQVRAFTDSGYGAWLTLHETDRPREMGIVVLEGDRVVDLVEKPAAPRSNLALVGIWMLAPGAVEYLRAHPLISPRGEVELSGTLEVMLREGHGTIGGAVFPGDWFDTGTLASLLRTQAALLDVPALVAPGASVEASHLGPNVVVGAGARLVDVTLSHALVAPGARLEHVQASGIVVTADGQVVSA